jgi:hypothetical protein
MLTSLDKSSGLHPLPPRRDEDVDVVEIAKHEDAVTVVSEWTDLSEETVRDAAEVAVAEALTAMDVEITVEASALEPATRFLLTTSRSLHCENGMIDQAHFSVCGVVLVDGEHLKKY